MKRGSSTTTGTEEHPARRAERGQGRCSGIDPFALFCAYHLGITDENTYRFQNVHEVARRFGKSSDEVQAALAAYRLDSDVLLHSGFDLASAQADVQLSPAGVDLTVLARMHYEAVLDAEPFARDWEAELSRAREEKEEIFGAGGGRLRRERGGS
jgi:hypothetical protein